MGKEEIVARILADAQSEAETIQKEAEAKAEQIVSLAAEAARLEEERTRSEARKKADAVLEGKRAAARLDCAKILLGEKRRVIDAVYEEALTQLLALGKEETLALFGRLLEMYAEEGDEVYAAGNCKYSDEIKTLPAVKEKRLTVSSLPAEIDGGLLLCGKKADKDLSYASLLAEDRQEHQAEIAMDLFGKGTSV